MNLRIGKSIRKALPLVTNQASQITTSRVVMAQILTGNDRLAVFTIRIARHAKVHQPARRP